MLDTCGATHLGYAPGESNAMGGALSKVFRRPRVFIDLTRDDNESHSEQQHELPSFEDFIRKEFKSPETPRTPSQTKPLPLPLPLPGPAIESSPLTSLETALRTNFYGQEPDTGVTEANHGPQVVSIEDTPPPGPGAFPIGAEVVDLVSPDVTPEPRTYGSRPVLHFSHQDEERREYAQSNPADFQQLNVSRSHAEAVVAAASQSKIDRVLQRTQLKSRQRLLKRGSAKDPILIPEDPIHPYSSQHTAPAPQAPFQVVQTQVSQPAIVEPKVASWNTLVLFTDGSFINNRYGGSGVAFWRNGHWNGQAFALGQVSGGSYEAEARAIIEAFKFAPNMLLQHHVLVEVCTDHVGLVKGIGATQTRPNDKWLPKVIQAGQALKALGVRVKLTWVKGHDVHAGNQMADRLARLGSERSAESARRFPCIDPFYQFDRGLGEVQISDQDMMDLSTRAESSAAVMLGTVRQRAVTKEARKARKKEGKKFVKEDRRAHKLALRAQRGIGRYFLRSQANVV